MEIVERLRRDMARILAQPDFRKKLDDLGMEIDPRSPAEFAAAIPAESCSGRR